MRNLFIRLHECRVGDDEDRFGTGWENLFTEQFAFYLACDPAAARDLAAALLGEDPGEVAEVTLQPSTEDGKPATTSAGRSSSATTIFARSISVNPIPRLLPINPGRSVTSHPDRSKRVCMNDTPHCYPLPHSTRTVHAQAARGHSLDPHLLSIRV